MSDMIDRAAAIAELDRHAKGDALIGGQHFRTLTLEVAVEAIAALPPALDAVEALEWRGFDRSYLDTRIPFGYAIVGDEDEGWQVSLSWRTCEETLDGTHSTMDAARTAAEADLIGRLAAIRAGGGQ